MTSLLMQRLIASLMPPVLVLAAVYALVGGLLLTGAQGPAGDPGGVESRIDIQGAATTELIPVAPAGKVLQWIELRSTAPTTVQLVTGTGLACDLGAKPLSREYVLRPGTLLVLGEFRAPIGLAMCLKTREAEAHVMGQKSVK